MPGRRKRYLHPYVRTKGGYIRLWIQHILRRIGKVGAVLSRGSFSRILQRAFQGVQNSIRPKIRYSREWYEQVYHQHACVGKTFSQYIGEYASYRQRLLEALAEVDLPWPEARWLEVGCMQGKTAYWILERHPKVHMHMFDFSAVAIEWIRENLPLGLGPDVWVGSIDDIRRGEARFDAYFDVVSCIDVTEHLPKGIYHRGIAEMHRVLRPGGLLLLMQGNALQPEHINVLPEDQLVKDFCSVGFRCVRHLPHRHYLLTKPEQVVTSTFPEGIA